jgi:hypothetical protein
MGPGLDFGGWQSGGHGVMPGMIFGYHFSLEEIPDRFTWIHWSTSPSTLILFSHNSFFFAA